MNRSDSLNRYFKSIKDLNPLTKDQELELARKAQAGCARSLNRLVEHNLKIVVTIANKNVGRGIPVDDLVQQGNLGLMEAAKRFNPDNNVRFTSYAGTWVLKYMNKLIDRCGRIVRIPVNQEIERFNAIKRGEDVANLAPVHIDQKISEDNETSKSDVLFSVGPDVNQSIEQDHKKKTVTRLLASLKDRDREVTELYYGVNLEGGMKAADIAERLGLTQIRVYQILNQVREDLKARV